MKIPRFLFGVLTVSLLLTGCDDLPFPTDKGSESASSSASTSSASESASSASTSSASESSSSSSSVTPLPEVPHQAAGLLPAGSGSGYDDTRNWAPGICFPLADTPAYANSQVYRPGGSAVPSNPSQCAPENYAYPWIDNFCESRSWVNPVCNSGKGHQGQDLRPKACTNNTYWAVAAEDGVITQMGSYTVALTADAPPYRVYRYLHLQNASLKVGLHDRVKRGQKIGKVSNNMGTSGGKPVYTTIHLHFEIRVSQSETLSDGTMLAENAFVPPYTALLDAYQRKLAGDCPVVE
ncbi:MAG: M23 family metallopeptidase [Asticcacaulis sp.]